MHHLISFVLFFLATTADLFSCDVERIESLNYSIDLEKEQYVSYRVDRINHKIPYFRATNCSKAAMERKFLMIAFGPEVKNFYDTVKGLNFNKDFGNRICEMTNLPFSIKNHSFRKEQFQNNWHFISSCTEIHVEDEGPQPLRLPKDQPGCKVTKDSNHKMSFNGGFCFVQPNFGSSYLIQLKIKEECLNSSFHKLIQNKVFDLYAGINLYLAGDASGRSSSLRSLSNLPVRISVNPMTEIMPTSEDFGLLYPRWPEQWPTLDIGHAGLKLTDTGGDRFLVETPIAVNNICQESCKNGFCQSPCQYSQPIVAENSLFAVHPNDEPELITTWYDGGIASGNFQGIINGIGFEVPEMYFEEGKDYYIESRFLDPKLDFELFKKRVRNRLNRIEQQLGRISSNAIPRVQEIPSILESRLMPGITAIPDVIFNQPLNSVDRAVEELRSYLSFKLWPPYYSKGCYLGNCSDFSNHFLNLKIHFKFLKRHQYEKADIKILSIERKSQIINPYKNTKFISPKLECAFSNN